MTAIRSRSWRAAPAGLPEPEGGVPGCAPFGVAMSPTNASIIRC